MADRLSAVESADGRRGTQRRTRKSSEARRAELLAVAREVMAAGGLSEGGMAEVAVAAGVSNGLLYHYFPAGRSELVDAVAHQLLDDLCDRMGVAANLPFSALGRLEQALAVLFGFFTEHPVAYDLLLAAEGSPAGEGVQALAQVRLVSTMTTLMAAPDRSADELLDLATRLLDSLRDELARARDGEDDPEGAWRESCREARRLFGPAA
jgi:AcrR family transcriptional regulator